MANGRADVRVNMKPLQQFTKQLHAQSQGMAPGPIDDFYKQAGARILAMNDRRFDQLSRGGSFQGESWAPLAPATLRGKRRRRRRRTARGPRRTATLIDTATLKNALARGAPGNVIRRVAGGIIFGIGGGAAHPEGPTIGQIAAFHQRGAGKLPQRPVVTGELDRQTLAGIANDARRAIEKLGKQAERG